MVVLTIAAPATLPAGEIVAANMPAEEYLERYAATHHEWVRGVVIKMAPASFRHTALVDYLRDLLRAYFDLNPLGLVLGEPFVMRLKASDTYREPDLQVVLKTNPGELTDTAMIGPADICIEVVSPESAPRDYGDKFVEYERAGVQEYWIIDPQRQQAHFYRLQESHLYAMVSPDEQGYFQTPLLPRLALYVPTFWANPLPGFFAIGQTVRAMFQAD
jgi:Uma2 family endonuclease